MLTTKELDTADVNELILALMRRRQETTDSLLALLDLMVLCSGNFSGKNKYRMANLLRDKADLIERPN
jgi:hypothetical protein